MTIYKVTIYGYDFYGFMYEKDQEFFLNQDTAKKRALDLEKSRAPKVKIESVYVNKF